MQRNFLLPNWLIEKSGTNNSVAAEVAQLVERLLVAQKYALVIRGNPQYDPPMPQIACTVCSKEFYIKPNRILKGWGKYCSKVCNYRGQKTGDIFACSVCGKPKYKGIAEQQRSRSGQYFCGKSCQTIWRNSKIYTRENHSNWKGGEKSYRDFMRRTSIEKWCQRCKTADTRVLAVHHKDRNRQNNTAANLIWLCHNCHYLVHHHKEEAAGFVTA